MSHETELQLLANLDKLTRAVLQLAEAMNKTLLNVAGLADRVAKLEARTARDLLDVPGVKG